MSRFGHAGVDVASSRVVPVSISNEDEDQCTLFRFESEPQHGSGFGRAMVPGSELANILPEDAVDDASSTLHDDRLEYADVAVGSVLRLDRPATQLGLPLARDKDVHGAPLEVGMSSTSSRPFA